MVNMAEVERHHSGLEVKAAGDGGELVVVELQSPGVTGAASVTVGAGLGVAEAQSAAQSPGLGAVSVIVGLGAR